MSRPAMGEVWGQERSLNRLISTGRLLDAYCRYRESRSAPVTSDPVRSRVLRFFDWADRFVNAELVRTTVVDSVAYSEWRVSSEWGCSARSLVTARDWVAGQVEQERLLTGPCGTRAEAP